MILNIEFDDNDEPRKVFSKAWFFSLRVQSKVKFKFNNPEFLIDSADTNPEKLFNEYLKMKKVK